MKIVFLTVIVGLAAAEQKSYDGYAVLRTAPLAASSAALVRKLLTAPDLDFWQEPNVGRHCDVMVGPHARPYIEKFFANNNITFSQMGMDVQKMIEEAQRRVGTAPKLNTRYSLDWNDYHPHDAFNEFIDELAASNSDWVNTVSIGKTVEGRDMRVIQITKAGPGKPNVWMEAGIHAREWISSAVGTYVIRELVENYDQHKDIVDNINFHALPSANPDGYEYSRSSERYWRKNRSPNSGSSCVGVDLNRNWGYHWAEAGVSHSPCSDVYCGEAPFDQIESSSIRDYVESLNPTPVLGHCFHSYSQLWLWPYGYGFNAYPPNKEEVKQLAEDAADALYQVHGTVFDPINSADLYPAAGAADDWYMGGLGARLAFTTELRDTGFWGFELPPEQIIPSGEEIWAGMEVVFRHIMAISKKE
jgi:murein tripeptide amidase MpaA